MSRSPITQGYINEPPTYPLGFPINDRVMVNKIDRSAADRIYQNHHSYLPCGRKGWHYGVYLDRRIAGAISFDAWPSEHTIRGHESAGIREVSRVCIANDTPNLASCSMSKAQDGFPSEHGDGIELLVTYVREDYEGSMFAALRGKGWERDGTRDGGAPGNREERDIHGWGKTRWVCEL